MSKMLTIENVRISYPNLFQPKQINGQGSPKFSAAFLIPESNPGLKKLFAIAEELCAEKYPDGLPRNFKTLPCYNAADEPKYAGKDDYKGVWILNSSKHANNGAPQIVDANMNKVLDQASIYPGLYVNVAVSIYVYEAKNAQGGVIARGVTTGLEAIQIVRDGDRLDNRPSANELFQPIDVQEGTAGGGLGGPPDPLA